MKAEPRIALFTDSFLEINGVAHTSRMFAAFAVRRNLPMLVVHAGPETEMFDVGSIRHLALKRGPVGVRIDSDLRFDVLLWRYARAAIKAVREFGAEAVHITGPSDIGLLGAYVAYKLRLPLIISWHTNVHEYAGRRLNALTGVLPAPLLARASSFAERFTLRLLVRFYKLGRVLLAPNEELGEMLAENCGRPVFMMWRGVETELFSPVKRLRSDATFTLGYVGRLTPEKNVRLLARIEQGLIDRGLEEFRFVAIGAGSEREWLEANMRHAEFTGVLMGDSLARAYANFDLFIFPSTTDTFGNVVLEALASGVPAIVSDQGGPKHIIRPEVSGLVASKEAEFVEAVMRFKTNPEMHRRMQIAARDQACAASWDSVFEAVYQAYAVCLQLDVDSRPTMMHQPQAEFAGTNAIHRTVP